MKTCAKCGATGTALTRERLATHSDTVLKMPVVLVNAVDRFHCGACGHNLEVIANHEGLISAVALCRVLIPVKLNGDEIRLLRKTMSKKAVEFAKWLDFSPESLSRWENNAELMGASTEKNLRLRVALALMEKAPAIEVNLKELMAIEIQPVRPSPWQPLWLEMVRVKDDAKKETQWDKAA